MDLAPETLDTRPLYWRLWQSHSNERKPWTGEKLIRMSLRKAGALMQQYVKEFRLRLLKQEKKNKKQILLS